MTAFRSEAIGVGSAMVAAGLEPAATALLLAGQGHPILPLHTPAGDVCSCGCECGNAGKHPRGGCGLRSATTDLEQIGEWWSAWPTANVGLRCDGLLVLDVDGDQGERSLGRLEHGLGAPDQAQRLKLASPA